MKKLWIFLITMPVFLFLGCPGPSSSPTPQGTAVTGVNLNHSELELGIGGTSQLSAAVTPADADDTSVSWSSSNPDAATVSEEGLVTGKASGSATITVETSDGGFRASCSVEVFNAYTVSFESNGGTVFGDRLVREGMTVNLPDTPEKPGYSFTGWYVDEGFAFRRWDSEDTVTSDVTLYAKWELVTYSITYELNGSTQDSRNPDSYTIEDCPLTLYASTSAETNYACSGWYSSATFEEGDKIETLPAESSGDIKLYAKHGFIYKINESVLYGFSNYWNNSIVDIGLPSEYDSNTIAKILDLSFDQNSAIEKLTIPATIYRIGYGAFKGCANLAEVTIQGNAEYTDGTNTSSIGMEVFKNCSSLEEVHFEGGNTIIYSAMFKGCTSLTTVDFPDALVVRSTDDSALIYDEAFSGCTSLESIDLPDNCNKIIWEAFNGCTSLREIAIPETLTVIDHGAFKGCSSLESITLPASMTTILYHAFRGCTALSSVTIKATTPPTLGANVFTDCSEDLKIYVPAASVDDYKAAINWSNYADKIVAQP